MNIDILLVYIVVSFFYVLSPGPAVFLAISNGMTTNMQTVLVSSLGNVIGLFFLSAVSILGLGALLLSSAYLFLAVKIVGAMYLVYLGVKQWRQSSQPLIVGREQTAIKSKKMKTYFLESLFLAATNPKPILFFVALFPQFLSIEHPITPQFFTLTGIFMLTSLIVLCGYGYLAKAMKGVFTHGSFMQWFHRVTGSLFILMGFLLLRLKNI
jgi:threonine/homoserine/homoserine lactone efflux protein